MREDPSLGETRSTGNGRARVIGGLLLGTVALFFATGCFRSEESQYSASLWDGTGRWVEIAREPGIRASGDVVWGEGRLFVWGGVTHQEGDRRVEGSTYPPDYRGYYGADSVDGLVFNPERNTWEEIPSAPLPFLGFQATVVWTGDELLVWGPDHHNVGPGTTRSMGALYEPDTKTWKRMADFPHLTLGTGVWSGEELFVMGSDRDHRNRAAAYDPENDRWRELPAPPGPHSLGLFNGIAWTGSRLLAGSDDGTVWVYDPSNDTLGQSAPSPYSGRVSFRYGWAAGLFLQYGGSLQESDMLVNPAGVAGFNPASNEWRTFSDPPGIGSLGGPIDIEGRALFLGSEASYSLDPAQDRWEAFAPSPVFGAVWTGESLLAFGSNSSRSGELYSSRRLLRYEPSSSQ